MNESEVNEPDAITYATEHRRITGADLFGVVVRAVGLLLTIWGMYVWLYLFNVFQFQAPTENKPPITFLLVGAFWISIGLVLLKGGWIVRFAYGSSDSKR